MTSLTRGRSSRSWRSPYAYKLLGSTPQDLGGSQVTPNNLEDTTLQKLMDGVVDDGLLALVLQTIVFSTLNHSLTDLAWV